MKVKNKLTRRIIVSIALIALITILGSGIINIVQATSTMTVNGNTIALKDFYGKNINLDENVQHKSLRNLFQKENEIVTYNGLNYEKVNIANQRTSDSKYGFSFTLSEDTKMEVWKDGFTDKIEYKKLRGTEKESESKDISFFPINYNQSGKFGVYIYNAGLYTYTDAKTKEEKICNIGLKLTFSWEDWKVNNIQQFPFINVRTYSEGSKRYGLFFSFTNMSYATKIEIFEGDPKNGTKRDIDMNMTLVDIDDRQFFGVGKFNGEGEEGLKNHINRIQFTNDSNVYTNDEINEKYADYVWFYANDDNTTNHENVIQDSVRLELKDVNRFSFVTGTKHDPCSYNYGKRFYLNSDESNYYSKVNYAIKMGSETTEGSIKKLIKDYISSDAEYPAMVGYFTNEPFYPYDLSKPIERIDDKNQTNVKTNEIGKDELYTYKIYHYVPNAVNGLRTAVGSVAHWNPLLTESQYLKEYKFTTNIPTEVTHEANTDKKQTVHIYKLTADKDGKQKQTDVTNKFEINDTGTIITATAKLDAFEIIDPADPEKKKKINEFYNNTYLFAIDVVEKAFNKSSNAKEEDNTKTYTVNHFSSISGTSKINTVKLTTQKTNTVNTNYKEIKIPITKVWVDNSNAAKLRPEKITYSITAVTSDGTPVHTFDSGEITTDTNNTKEVYSGFVPLKNENEQYMIYQISEGNIPNYAGKVEYTKNGEQITKVTITNTLSASFKITTRVDGTGGTISGSGQNPYETVEAGKNSTKDITITPNSGYQIKSITINGKTQQLPTNVKNPYTLNKFTNMYEDKEVVVKFEPIPKATGIVNHYLKGSNPLQKLTESTNLTNLEIGESLAAEKYKANIKHYTYDSAIPSSITVNEESSKNVLNLYYTLNKYGYTVEYYYDGVKDENETETNTADFGKQITTYEDKSKEIYKLEKTENVPLTISDNPSNNVMKIYYVMNENEKEYDYSIEYYYDNKKDETATVTGKAKYESIINNYTDKKKDGYVFKKVENKPLTITKDSSKNIMKVYYVSDAKITTKYIDKETGKEIADSKTENTKIGEKYNTEKKDIEKYSYVSDTGNTTGTVDKPEIEVIYYYEPIREIIVKYVDKQTGEEIADPSTNNGKTGDKFDITSKKQEINGYTLIEEPTEKEATYGKDPQTFTYYYAKNSKIIIRYVDEDTGEQIEKEVEKTGYIGETFDINGSEKNISGYYLVQEPKVKTGNYTENEQILTYYYRKDPGLANKPIPKTGMNEVVRNTSIIALLIVLSNGLRLFVRYKKEEKRSMK